MIAAKQEMWRELNALNDQILRLEKQNADRLEEIDRLRLETDEIKRQNEARSNDVFTYLTDKLANKRERWNTNNKSQKSQLENG